MIRIALGLSSLSSSPSACYNVRNLMKCNFGNEYQSSLLRRSRRWRCVSVGRRLYHGNKEEQGGAWWVTMGTVGARMLSALCMISLVGEYGLEWTLCEGPSMKPTIAPKGDIILLERWSHRWYGLDGGDVGQVRSQIHQAKQQQEEEQSNGDSIWRGSFIQNVKNIWIQFFITGVNVGDVIVLHHPLKESTICKRVLGLPGDTVILSSSANRDNIQHAQNLQNLFFSSPDYPNSLSLNNSSFITVPDGHVWIEGDNSANSSDSRHYGTVPANLIIGKVICRIWPIFPIMTTINTHFRMIRMWRPSNPNNNQNNNAYNSGSIVLPAGYTGQELPQNYFYHDTDNNTLLCPPTQAKSIDNTRQPNQNNGKIIQKSNPPQRNNIKHQDLSSPSNQES